MRLSCGGGKDSKVSLLLVAQQWSRLLAKCPPGSVKAEYQRHRDGNENGRDNVKKIEHEVEAHDLRHHRPGGDRADDRGHDRRYQAEQPVF